VGKWGEKKRIEKKERKDKEEKSSCSTGVYK
jgi:hypothetical protein